MDALLPRPALILVMLTVALLVALTVRAGVHSNAPAEATLHARDRVKQALDRPGAVTFANERNGCGEVSYLTESGVNVKHRRFIVLDGGHVLLRTADAPVEFALIWNGRCGR